MSRILVGSALNPVIETCTAWCWYAWSTEPGISCGVRRPADLYAWRLRVSANNITGVDVGADVYTAVYLHNLCIVNVLAAIRYVRIAVQLLNDFGLAGSAIVVMASLIGERYCSGSWCANTESAAVCWNEVYALVDPSKVRPRTDQCGVLPRASTTCTGGWRGTAEAVVVA